MICLRPRLFVNIFQIFLFCRTTRQIQTESLLSFVYDKGSSYILCRIRKDGYQMQNIPKEYLLLFNAITDAEESLRRLLEVLDILKLYVLDSYVSFDLGMLGNYMYYTGVIFRGYTYGVGDAVIKGGRYDNLLGHFGKEAPSIGFAAVLNQLMNALARQKIEILSEQGRYLMLYRKADRKEAIRKASDYRRQGKYVELRQVPEDWDGQMNDMSGRGPYIGVIQIGENRR